MDVALTTARYNVRHAKDSLMALLVALAGVAIGSALGWLGLVALLIHVVPDAEPWTSPPNTLESSE